MFPTKVLLATDGSPESARAAQMAVELSNKLDWELHVVYVEHIPGRYGTYEAELLSPGLYERMREGAERDAREKLEEQAEKIGWSVGDLARAHPRVGRPDAEIVRLAEGLGAGLVVVGSRGFGPLRRTLLGSVANSVVRHAHTSVLVVRGEGRLLGRILLAIDGSKEASAAARLTARIASVAGSDLHVLHVLETAPLLPWKPYPGPMTWETGGILEKAEQDAREFVARQAERIEAEGGTVKESHLSVGKPDREIVRLAEELDADLIVLGSRGLGSVGRVLLGSVSDSVVCHADCSVLVVRSETVASVPRPGQGRKEERR